MPSLRSVGMIAAVLCASTSASCFNPVHDDAVNALGDEAPGVRADAKHRPGQPCGVCHGGEGPATDFVIAGTIYRKRGNGANGGPADWNSEREPLVNVVLIDALGARLDRSTNSVGNFFLTKDDWSPTYPISVRLEYGKEVTKMVSLVSRSVGCASCHYGQDKEPSHMPPVYVFGK